MLWVVCLALLGETVGNEGRLLAWAFIRGTYPRCGWLAKYVVVAGVFKWIYWSVFIAVTRWPDREHRKENISYIEEIERVRICLFRKQQLIVEV